MIACRRISQRRAIPKAGSNLAYVGVYQRTAFEWAAQNTPTRAVHKTLTPRRAQIPKPTPKIRVSRFCSESTARCTAPPGPTRSRHRRRRS